MMMMMMMMQNDGERYMVINMGLGKYINDLNIRRGQHNKGLKSNTVSTQFLEKNVFISST